VSPATLANWVQNAFYDKHDRLFVQKTDGAIYMVAPGNLASTDGMVKLAGNTPPANSDGAHCRNASVYSESTQPSFNCNDGNAYIITHGGNGECYANNNNTNLAVINTETYTRTSLTNITSGIQSGLINAIGFNSTDGYIWGYRFGTGHMARIGSNGSVQYFAIPGLASGCGGTVQNAFGAGDITADGIYYGYQGNLIDNNNKLLYKIDLNPASPTYLTILDVRTVAPPSLNIHISDIAFNPVDKNLYGVGSDKNVYRINTANWTIASLGAVTFTGGNVVATFCDPAGNFYFQSASAPLYRIPNVQNGGTLTASLVTNTQLGEGNGDAARCPLTFFAGITLSGNIWNDVDANRIKAGGEVNTVTNDPSETLTVYLVNDANVIVGKADVNPDGTWQIPTVPAGTYTLSLSNDASLAISSLATALAQDLPDDWVYTGTNFGTPGAAGSWNGQVVVGASDTNKSNLNFGIQQIPTAGNGSSTAVNQPGSASIDVPLTTFTNLTPSSDASTGTVASIAITAIPAGATSITINGVKYGDGGQTIPTGGVVIQTGTNGLPIAGTIILVDPIADGVTTVTIPFVAIDNAGARSVNSGVEGTAVLNLTAAPITISGTVWNDADATAIKDGTEPFTNAGGLFANLVTPAGVVLQSVPVDPTTGQYDFSNVPANTTYNIILTEDDKTSVTDLTASELPSGWVNTGVNLDGTPATGNTTGVIAVNAGIVPVTNQNFGIEEIPTAGNGTNTAVNAAGQISVPLSTFNNGNNSTDPAPGNVASIIITAIPTGASSININGTLYGAGGTPFPPDGITLPTDVNGLPTGATISVDPIADGVTTVTIPFVAIDNAGARSVNSGVEGTAVLNLTATPITISGTVWNDADATAIKDGTEPFTNAGGLFANLVTPAGVVLQSVPVDPTTGQYDFSNVTANTTYNIILTEDDKTGVTDLTASELPSGWVNTGVNLDGTPATGNTTGVIAVNAGIVPVTNQNFGIEQTPTADAVTLTNVPNSTFGTTPPAGFSDVPNYQSAPLNHPELESLSGNDPEDCPTTKCSTGATFIIESIKTSNTILYYDFGGTVGITEVVPGTSTGTIVDFDPAKLVLYGAVGSGSSADPLEFTYQLVDEAGIPSAPVTYSVSTSSSLPVTLTSFNAKKGEGFTTRLDWTTTAETNSEKFEVEHSTDAKIWNVVANIAAKGESNELSRYNYTHTTPVAGENLYRLRMVDFDGTFAYSRINSVDFAIGVHATLYPNPTSDKIKVKLDGAIASDVTKVNVTAQDGKTVYTANKLSHGEVDVKNLTSGTYVVTITLKNGTTQTSKIVIVR
jgi:hypothetical protein